MKFIESQSCLSTVYVLQYIHAIMVLTAQSHIKFPNLATDIDWKTINKGRCAQPSVYGILIIVHSFLQKCKENFANTKCANVFLYIFKFDRSYFQWPTFSAAMVYIWLYRVYLCIFAIVINGLSIWKINYTAYIHGTFHIKGIL